MHKTLLTTENIASLGGIFAIIMDFTPLLTALMILTALILNIMKIIDWYKKKK